MPPKKKSGGVEDGPRQRKPAKVVNQEPASEEPSEPVSDAGKIKDMRKKVPKPYIGDIDDPNIDDFVIDNVYLKTGYRIGFHTYWDAARSFFMLHNESMNVWTHFGGMCIFIGCVFYVMIYLQPTSLHEAPLPQRWISGFDNGRFDFLQCDNPNFKFPQGEQQCPYRVDEILDDLLETD